jgi:hypothetical protein
MRQEVLQVPSGNGSRIVDNMKPIAVPHTAAAKVRDSSRLRVIRKEWKWKWKWKKHFSNTKRPTWQTNLCSYPRGGKNKLYGMVSQWRRESGFIRGIRRVIEESNGDDGIGILNGCPWYAFVWFLWNRLMTYFYPLLLQHNR